MTSAEAAALAQRLLDAFPAASAFRTREQQLRTASIYAEKLAPWDHPAAAVAVETLIDGARVFPTVTELRDAYAAAGGRLPDPGRRMSPAVDDPPELSPEERTAVAGLRANALAAIRRLVAKTDPLAIESAPDDRGGTR